MLPAFSSSPAVPVPEPAASREELLVQHILASEDFPAFSKVMSDLMASLRDDDASAQRLANLVLRDYALTVKVIRTANTVHYNRSGRAVQSATHALMLLGARTVRDLASGLLLFEQYRRHSPGLKELMLLSLLTASHAREAAQRHGAVDPETAQLCGMFRNLGEVLVAAHMQAEYSEILRRTRLQTAELPATSIAARARAQAAIAVLGCSFEDVAVAIARHWGMPEAVRRSMRATGSTSEDAIELVTGFGHDLATAIYREEQNGARDSVARVLHTYGQRLDLSRDALAAIADAAVAETRETFASARVALDDLRLTRQVAVALSEPLRRGPDGVAGADTLPALPIADGRPDTPSGGQASIGTSEPRPPVSGPALVALRERLTHDLATAVADVGAYEMQRAVLVALEAALRGGPFDRACFCAADVRAGELRGRFGLGVGVESLIARLSVPFASGGLAAGPALLRGEVVVLSLGIRQSLPEAHALRAWGAATAAFLPVALDGTTIGAVYVDRAAGGGVDVATLAYLRRVVASASQALMLRRARSVAPTASSEPARPVIDAVDRVELVLRILRGESIEAVAEGHAVTISELGRWRDEFLAAAVARLSTV